MRVAVRVRVAVRGDGGGGGGVAALVEVAVETRARVSAGYERHLHLLQREDLLGQRHVEGRAPIDLRLSVGCRIRVRAGPSSRVGGPPTCLAGVCAGVRARARARLGLEDLAACRCSFSLHVALSTSAKSSASHRFSSDSACWWDSASALACCTATLCSWSVCTCRSNARTFTQMTSSSAAIRSSSTLRLPGSSAGIVLLSSAGIAARSGGASAPALPRVKRTDANTD